MSWRCMAVAMFAAWALGPAWAVGQATADGERLDDPMQITIDVRDLGRKLVHAELTLPLGAPSDAPRQVALWYPKWVPGSHGPGGPIANIGGLRIEDLQGNVLSWVRTPGEVFRFQVDVPPGVDRLRIFLRYIANQPTTNSFGHDCFGGRAIGVISPGTVLLCLEEAKIDDTRIVARLQLPHRWEAATALPVAEARTDDDNTIVYQPASLRVFIDSPIMCGLHHRSYDLVEEPYRDRIPPHWLHVFGDDAGAADLNEAIVAKLQSMVTQAALLTGSHPFDRFDVLLAASDELPANGLEHSRSSFNVLSPSALASPSELKGWNRLLIPHEYLHAWCGKYRRPAGMMTNDFHTPHDTSLLWVYEGLTQYLGELVEARCGLMNQDEFRHRLTVELRNASHRQGRQWQSLADTAAASHILRDGSRSWPGLRRSQDYYMEGMLFWLEADALIRRGSQGQRSLDDFCQAFLGATPQSPHPHGYTRQDVVDHLRAVADVDWEGLIRRRVESFQQGVDSSVADLLGYEFRLTREAPSIPGSTYGHRSGIDAYDSLGLTFNREGAIQNVLIGSPADQARLGPGMKIVGVNGRTWSGAHLNQALVEGQDGRPIELLTTVDEDMRTIQLSYFEGPRYWNLVRREDSPDLLQEILQPKP